MEAFVKILFVTVVIRTCCQHSYVESQNVSNPATNCTNTEKCPCCSVNVSCPTNRSGQCGGECKDGYHGGRCHNLCPDNCIRCVDAHQGGGVSNCTLCKDGFYSTASMYQCQLKCSKNCTTCESGESKCTSCQTGFYLTSKFQCIACDLGSYFYKTNDSCLKCNETCYSCNSSDTCFCSNGCLSGSGPQIESNCDINTSRCLFGCNNTNFASADGFNDTCGMCIIGNYGIKCDETCHPNCASSGCNRMDGTCIACKVGFHGDNCDNLCPGNCSDKCDKTKGHCGSCKSGSYGQSCNMACQQNCKTCIQSNGSCATCTAGTYGTNCTKSCPPNCKDRKCNRTTGHCDSCLDDFSGINCSTPITKPFSSTEVVEHVITEVQANLAGLVAGGTVAVVLVISICVVLAVFLVKRRSSSSFKGNFNVINLDEYKLGRTDVLEDNEEFDPTYFTGKVNDAKKPCGQLYIKDLAQFVETHGDNFYKEEFLKLPRGLIKPCEDAKLEENIIKNRYTGIYPYDEHRVKLLPPGSDFINACYIDGFRTRKKYISSLGPTRKAMEGFQLFWRMVWQEKTDVIVMLTNLMEGQSMQCEQYWPGVGSSLRYGNIVVTVHSEDVYSEFVVRKMTLSMGSENRTLNHLHYTAWPDKQVPNDVTSLIEFRRKVNATESYLGGPIIVHCSAGIGRTGTYIAMDILIHQGKAHKSLDIFEWVTRMREQRTSMVQTWQQYDFLHRSLVHALTFHCEPIKESQFQQFMDSMTDKRLKTIFKHVSKPEKPGEGEEDARTMNRCSDGMNREGADIPGSLNRPLLYVEKRFGDCNYINAVYVNGYKIKSRFLVCQTPLPETVKDFLTLIVQETCSCIVSMDPPGLKDPTIGEYFSRTNDGTFFLPSGIYEVETQELDKNPSYMLRKLIIQHNKRSGSSTMTVYHYQCHHWPYGNRVPDVSYFLQLVQDVDAMADRGADHGPVLVHCLNAAERSGLYCAVSNLVQKIGLEGEVSVINTLRQVKVRRPLAIPNKEQILFCYKAIQQFLDLRKHEESVAESAIYCNV